jgi:hypothetical protein
VLTRHRGSRAPTLFVAAILAAVIVAGCRAQPVDESGLDDIEDSDPVEAEEPEPDPEDDLSEDEGADEPEGDASAEALDEPDGDGGLIPESAFEINDDLDLDAEAQIGLLRTYAATYELIEAVLAGEDDQMEQLRPRLTPSQFASVEASRERLRSSGEVQRGLDRTTPFVRLEEFGSGEAVVEHCLRNGPATGTYDEQTGELLFSPDREWLLLHWRLVLLIDDDERAMWAIDEGALVDDEDCT